MTENVSLSFNPIQIPGTAPRGTLKKKGRGVYQTNKFRGLDRNQW